MKKLTQFLTRISLLSALFLFVGCKKYLDKIFPGHGNDEEGCKIASLTERDRTALYYYNAKGNPDSVIFDETFGSGGSQLEYFEYNNQHKLIGHGTFYSYEEDDYEVKNKYVYENGRIVIDTQYTRVAAEYVSVNKLEYDAEGRVVREIRQVVSELGEPVVDAEKDTINYVYNAAGNRFDFYFLPGGSPSPDNSVFDDKKYIYRDSKVFNFVRRNYSKNNGLGVEGRPLSVATGYNEQGYPLGFTNPEVGSTGVQFTYNCD